MTRFARLCLLALAGGTFLFGQDISGTIGGAILDQNGATVPNAKVTVTNTERNQIVRTTTTDATGIYSAPLIPVGTYAIKVEANGFKTENRTDITLNVSDDLKINFTLQVGTITESVTVEESAVAVELGTPASATVIDGQQVRELSLGTRNYAQLVALMPGVVAGPTDELYIGNSAPSGFAAVVPYYVNGNRNSANNWTVDGADNVDRGGNLTLMTFPSVDAISQFKVERSLYTADTGRAGGAQISVVTKSGQSKFHGSFYEFFRNDVLTANNWANNANKVNLIDSTNPAASCTNNPNCKAKIPPLRWNDFGGTIGGPIYIPGKFNKERNKTFFFYSQEHRRVITYTTFNPTLPTQAMLTGAFSQPVCITVSTGGCPAGSTPVTQIPANLINPVSAAYIKGILSKLPLSATNSVAATTAGFFPQRNLYNSDQYVARLDHSFSEKFNIWGKFAIDQIPTTEPGGLFTGSTIPGGAVTNTNSPGRAATIHFINTIKPTLYNESGFNFTMSAIHAVPAGLMSKANNPDINPTLAFPNTQGVIPTVAISGGSSLIGYGPYDQFNKNFTWFDNLTWIKGRHTLKFGWTTHRYNKTENAASGQGTFSFLSTGVPTGTSTYQQAFANFLLGNVSTFTQPSRDITPDLWQWSHEAYVQDDWKVNPHLTVFAGVRWSFFGQPADSGELLTNFDPSSYNPANAPLIDPANGNKVAGTGNNPNTNGIIIGRVNSPYGKYVANQVYKNFAPRVGLAWDPFGNGRTSFRVGYGIYYDSGLVGTYEQNTFTNPPYVQSVTISNAPFNNITGGTLAAASLAPLVLRATQVPALIPYTQQWSFNIQRTLAKDTTFEVGYFGTKGTHLLGIVDINQALPGAAYAAGLHQANGNTIFTTTDTPRINAVRPYKGFNAINAIRTAFDSNYHSLQSSFTKRFARTGSVRASYTYSKTLTDNGTDRSNAPQNSYNWHNGEYGPAPGDRTHVLSFNYVYEIPIFRGSRGFVAGALKGWQVSGIGSIYSGQAFTVTTSNVDPAGSGLLGSSAASARPDMICNPQENAPHQYAGAPSASSPKWFNTACFAPVPEGAIRPGNAGRGTVRGPGFTNMDITVSKYFNLNGDGRWKLQVRGESFNTFNLVNPNGISSTNITSTTFGVISSYRAPRRVQLAAKITF